LFVTLEDDARLDIREHRGSPSELADKEYAFHATQRGARIERHYAPVLVEAIARAAGFSIMIRETNRAAA
jgi:hypothetical protein